jgi:hypothetical protein
MYPALERYMRAKVLIDISNTNLSLAKLALAEVTTDRQLKHELIELVQKSNEVLDKIKKRLDKERKEIDKEESDLFDSLALTELTD